MSESFDDDPSARVAALEKEVETLKRQMRAIVGWLRANPAASASSPAPLNLTPPPRKASGKCRSCGAPIAWTQTESGKNMPINLDGTSHFSTCPNATQHRSPRR